MDKKEIEQEVLRYLEENPKTQASSIHGHIQGILRKRGKIGEIKTGDQYHSVTRTVRISDDTVMTINEVIYDLIAVRILTPGINADNLEWPFLSVTNRDKIDEYKRLELE
ncbi:hypothetical protein ACWGPW_14785 [Paenibacillus chitinolyticus]